MITSVDERLREEARRYGLRFGCEACAAYDADGGTCGHGYPNAEHRGVDLEQVDRVVFCKLFEAG